MHSLKKWWSVTQLCLTLCHSMDCSLPGSSVHGISQARILEWVAIPFPGVFLTQGLNLGFEQTNGSLALADTFFITEVPGKQSLKKSL